MTIRSVYDIEAWMNEMMPKSDHDRGKCVEWLTSYMIHNSVSVQRLFKIVRSDHMGILEQIFGCV